MANPSPWPAPSPQTQSQAQPAQAGPPPSAGGLEADLLLDRRRLKRSRALWRGLAVVALLGVLALGFSGAGLDAPGLGGLRGPHVLRLTVSGTITDDRKLLEAIDKAAESDSVRAMVLRVDSPGGTVAGGEGLHAALARFRQAKPLVAVFGGTAASAGYMIAMPAERIFAREGSVTGSIGVLLQSFDAQEAMRMLGLRAEAITSGPLKDQPSPFRPLSDEGRSALRAVVEDLHSQFVRMVAEGRRMPEERVRALADGRIMTGRQALSAGLVDAIGGEEEARAHLAGTHGIDAGLPVRDLRARDLRERTFGAALGEAFGAAAATVLGDSVKSLISEGVGGGLGVDGAWALWQPYRH
ncbi:signal peptide peptidase SppA [Roseomonas sp. SSH11]|uniref:Signal peptide peptidase SppA n=2 Tax=Pararoseomonas baculiformis TaxID=2820812 RepID=A0ABS4ACD3_9PROT|nr:signal peptide peptidase SppA [Pararoseomonas baculiformis]MBP0444665.1 signal peptide peptidase SppA [Pararoseomonas baculiformis]